MVPTGIPGEAIRVGARGLHDKRLTRVKASCLDLSVRIRLPLVQIPKLGECLYNSTRYWFHLNINLNELDHYQVSSIMYNPTSDLGIHVPCGAHMLLLSMCLCHTGAVLNIRPRALNFELSSP